MPREIPEPPWNQGDPLGLREATTEPLLGQRKPWSSPGLKEILEGRPWRPPQAKGALQILPGPQETEAAPRSPIVPRDARCHPPRPVPGCPAGDSGCPPPSSPLPLPIPAVLSHGAPIGGARQGCQLGGPRGGVPNPWGQPQGGNDPHICGAQHPQPAAPIWGFLERGMLDIPDTPLSSLPAEPEPGSGSGAPGTATPAAVPRGKRGSGHLPYRIVTSPRRAPPPP